MYRPSDIKKPDEFPKDPKDIFSNPHHLYYCFGKYEYEVIAQRLLDISQQKGKWVSLAIGDFIPPFQNREDAGGILERTMHESTLLIRKGKGFKLSSAAIEILAKEYPSEKTN